MMLDMLGGSGTPRDFCPEIVIDLFAGGGNSVPPVMAKALARANCADMALEVANAS